MKKYNFNCSFEIKSSHDVSGVGSSRSSSFVVSKGISCTSLFGLKNTLIEIEKHNESLYKFNVDSYDLDNQTVQIKYLNDLSALISFLIGKDEVNGYYGTPYIHLNLESFFCKEEIVQDHKINDNEFVINEFLHVRDSVSIQSTRHIEFDEKALIGVFNHEMLDVYRNGLKAESERSKFFHWFLILEYLEGTPLYSHLFPKGSMFSEEETKKIRDLADTLPTDKKGIVLSVLSRTSEYRGKKLSDLLIRIGVEKISNMQGDHEISVDTIKKIICARNKLFHSGTDFPTNILWLKLFPIVSAVIEKLVYDPQCVEKSS
ncbi:MAG TPA: hypothetical protein VIF37_10715 [Methylobacter sp.]